MNKNIYILMGVGVVAFLLVGAGAWFLFFRPTPLATVDTSGFGTAGDINNTSGGSGGTQSGTQVIDTSGSNSASSDKQVVFQITTAPVAGATLIQTLHPTTTLVRYIKQEDGHVFDLPLDVPGAVPRAVSNVTIPGGQHVLWVEDGNAALMQYVDSDVVKTIYLGFPVATTSKAIAPTRIQFLPDNIEDIAASPDGKSVVYLLKTASGVDGYITKDDGTNGKKVFSIPLSQILISWPSTNTLLANTKSAAGIEGIVFSIDAKSGSVSPIVSAQGITATANRSFSKIIYRTVLGGATNAFTYLHDVKSDLENRVALNLLPEKCLSSSVSTTTIYCAAPVQNISSNYLDLWHLGTASVADSIFSLNVTSNNTQMLAIPGSADGGVQSDILEMALSPDEHYLSFTTKGSRAVWGVRLGTSQ